MENTIERTDYTSNRKGDEHFRDQQCTRLGKASSSKAMIKLACTLSGFHGVKIVSGMYSITDGSTI
jgi:hypothetical protein